MIPHSKNRRPFYDIMRSVFSLDRMADEAYQWKKENGQLGKEQHHNIDITEDELEELV